MIARALLVLVLALMIPLEAHAYVGPGAGFAVIGSGLVFIGTFVLALVTFLAWPLQYVWRMLRRRGIPKNARARRIVVLGLDGLEPKLVDQYMQQGALPNMAELKAQGCYQRLGTTTPAISPVAWSSFQTGVNPGAHNIFDFLTRDKRNCMPQLSSTETDSSNRRVRFLGIPLWRSGASLRIMRKSRPFWTLLGERGIFSSIIRVPISYPPEPFAGQIVSAMCTPDLRGTQGTFSYYVEGIDQVSSSAGESTGGEVLPLLRNGRVFSAELIGPTLSDGNSAKSNFSLEVMKHEGIVKLSIGDTILDLRLNTFSDWTRVEFVIERGKRISGICRFCVRSVSPLKLYVSPVNINPEEPVLPISHPQLFSRWLAKHNGLFGTLGLMEDTWGRNETALDDARFLEQTWLTHDERERMFMESLKRVREGLCVGVFDASDRIQHMFWRYIDPKHRSPLESAEFADTIAQMYCRMDKLVGDVRVQLNPNDVLFVISDHGFSSFRRCININTWLMQQGLLCLKPDAKPGRDYFRDVDWSRSKAFAVGLSGMYINRKGRERNGIVEEKEYEQLKYTIAQKLEALRDPQDGEVCIRKVYDTAKIYRGLYTEEAPDLIFGFAPGYRVSWESVTGGIENEIFSDNLKAWSGDHHIDPSEVPGIFFCNRKIKRDDPHITDLAPSVLDLFAVPVPRYMEGSALV